MIFENYPVWLIVLDKSLVHTLAFPQFESREMLLSTLPFAAKSMFAQFLNDLRKEQLLFGSNPQADLILISGSPLFVNAVQNLSATHIAIIDHSHRFRHGKRNDFGITEMVTHTQVGGCTNFRLSYRRSPHLLPAQRTNLRRKIDSFINYSLPPSRITPPTLYYNLHDILPISHVRAYIQVPYRNIPGKFGFRQLNHSELCYVFGIKASQHPFICPSAFSFMVPAQLLYSLLLHNLQQMSRKPDRCPMLLPQPIHVHKKGFWLAALGKWLPECWSPQYKNEAVAKNDDASIPISLWDGRITSIFRLATSNTCEVLRRFLNRLFQRGLYVEVKEFLTTNQVLDSIELRGGVCLCLAMIILFNFHGDRQDLQIISN